MLAYLRKVTRRDQERGASAVEYGLMVAAIAAVIVGSVFLLGKVHRDHHVHHPAERGALQHSGRDALTDV